ncbi:MAG: DUF4189 domain-containing protein [Limnobacter sp.]|nr:DUF4189 domain-containing protein [Limnobacter sp.]
MTIKLNGLGLNKLLLALCLAGLHLYSHAFGAIAADSRWVQNTIGHGMFTGASNPAEASQEAMKACTEAGNSSCKIVLQFSQKCGAFAWSREYEGVGTGPSLALAEQAALQNCGNGICKIIVSDCE